jgi:hypothetical protein
MQNWQKENKFFNFHPEKGEVLCDKRSNEGKWVNSPLLAGLGVLENVFRRASCFFPQNLKKRNRNGFFVEKKKVCFRSISGIPQ